METMLYRKYHNSGGGNISYIPTMLRKQIVATRHLKYLKKKIT